MNDTEFLSSIENSVLVEEPKNLRQDYLDSLNELYPSIHSYKNPKVLRHYKMLKDRQPAVPTVDEYIEIMKARYKRYLYMPHNYTFWDDDEEEHLRESYDPEEHKKELALSPRDIKIANILKSQSRGVMICLSPEANYYPSVKSFVDRVAKTNCKQVKSAKYYFEIHTKDPKNPTMRMHCHMYLVMKNYNTKSKGNLRSYFKKRYPYMIIKMDDEKSALVYKPDITYGWKTYIDGLDSSPNKSTLKSLDKQWRKENNIPDILTL